MGKEVDEGKLKRMGRELGGFAENEDFLVLAVDDLFSSKGYIIATT